MQMELWSNQELAARSQEEPKPRQSAHHIRFWTGTALLCADLVGLSLAAVMAFYWIAASSVAQPKAGLALIVPLAFLICAFWLRAYGFETVEKVGKGFNRTFAAIITASGTIFLFLILSGDQNAGSLVLIGLFSVCATATIFMTRLVFDRLVSRKVRPLLFDRVFITDGVIADAPNGFRNIDARRQGIAPDANDPMMRHWAALFLQDADRVVLACSPKRYRQWARFLKGSNVRVEILMPELDDLGISSVSKYEQHTTVGISQGHLGRRDRILKRALDIIFATLMAAPAAALILICAILIKCEDGGPVFFRQRRMGRGNRLFDVMKMRSMAAHDSNQPMDDAISSQAGGITRIGRFMRRTSIDELPQLYNVLRGQMSLVGPRPHALHSSAEEKLFWEVDDKYWHRHAIKPGMTGLAQVRGFRGATVCENDLTDRLRSDLEYLEGWSVWRDLKIIAATFRVLVHKNAR